LVAGAWPRPTKTDVAPVAQNSWDTYIYFAPAADASSLDWTVDKEVGDDEKLVLDSTLMAALLVFVQRALLDPLALHAYLNPVQVPVDISVPKTVRGKPILTVSAAAQTRKTDSEPMTQEGERGGSESSVTHRCSWRTTVDSRYVQGFIHHPLYGSRFFSGYMLDIRSQKLERASHSTMYSTFYPM
jgi:hypothetical protein